MKTKFVCLIVGAAFLLGSCSGIQRITLDGAEQHTKNVMAGRKVAEELFRTWGDTSLVLRMYEELIPGKALRAMDELDEMKARKEVPKGEEFTKIATLFAIIVQVVSKEILEEFFPRILVVVPYLFP